MQRSASVRTLCFSHSSRTNFQKALSVLIGQLSQPWASPTHCVSASTRLVFLQPWGELLLHGQRADDVFSELTAAAQHKSCSNCATHETSPLPLERFWCCLSVWHLMYKRAEACCAAQRETVSRLCFLSMLYPCICAPRSAWNVFNYNFLNHCPAKGPLAEAAMTCLSKTIWVTPRETDKRGALTLILRHDKKSTESWGGVTERRGKKSNIKSEDEKLPRRWTGDVLQHFWSCRGEWREGWETKLAVSTILCFGSKKKIK